MIHLVFHISMLHKYLPPSHVLSSPDIQLGKNLAYGEVLVAIVDRHVKKLC